MDTATTNLVIGSLLGLLVSIITTLVNSYLSTTRERFADKRKASQDHFALIEKTYEDVLYLLDMEISLAASPSPQDTSDHRKQYSQEIRRHRARLELLSTPDVIEHFQLADLSIGELEIAMLTTLDKRPLTEEDINNAHPTIKAHLALIASMRDHLESIRQQTA
jgi:hypothetical protein